MRSTHMPFTLLLIMLLSVLVGCGSNSISSDTKTACDISSNILGNIVSISHASVSGSTASFVGAIFIDGSKEKHKAFDKVSVSVAVHTQILEKQEQKCRIVAFNALKIAQRVQIQSTGIVRETYPPQIDATEIVILAPKV
jgi:hypothetical protein